MRPRWIAIEMVRPTAVFADTLKQNTPSETFCETVEFAASRGMAVVNSCVVGVAVPVVVEVTGVEELVTELVLPLDDSEVLVIGVLEVRALLTVVEDSVEAVVLVLAELVVTGVPAEALVVDIGEVARLVVCD